MIISIRNAGEKDIDILNTHIPGEKIPMFHEQKLKEQKDGLGEWIIAWKNSIPIGHIQLNWCGSRQEKVREKFGKHANIESVGVHKSYRCRGVATQLVKYIEKLAKEKNYCVIGLSVGSKDNPYASNLYKKLGYCDWGKGTYWVSWGGLNHKNEKIQHKELCTFLYKKLQNNI